MRWWRWIITLILILSVGGGAAYAYIYQPLQKPAAEQPLATSIVYDLSVITTNLNEPTRMYIQILPEFHFNNRQTLRILEAQNVALHDMIIGILRNKTLQDVQGREGMQFLSDEIRIKANHLLAPAEIHRVYFREFIIQ